MKRSFELWYIFKRDVGDHAIFDDDHNDIQIYFNVQKMPNLKEQTSLYFDDTSFNIFINS